MKKYSIDNSFNKYSNEACFRIIKNLIKNRVYTAYKKVGCIAVVIQNISDRDLLDSTISMLKDCNYYKSESQLEPLLNFVNESSSYNQNDKTKLKAVLYSTLLTHEVSLLQWGEVFKDDRPDLIIYVENRTIKHNLESIYENIIKQITKHVVENYVEPLPLNEQELEFNKMINSMAEIDYDHNTSFFDKEIKYLSVRKKNILKSQIHTKNLKKSYFYTRVTSLFARGFIKESRTGQNKKEYYYKDEKFSTIRDLINHIQNELFEPTDNIRQYIEDSINLTGKKNLYSVKAIMKATMKYCTDNGYDISTDFISKHDQLMN